MIQFKRQSSTCMCLHRCCDSEAGNIGEIEVDNLRSLNSVCIWAQLSWLPSDLAKARCSYLSEETIILDINSNLAFNVA